MSRGHPRLSEQALRVVHRGIDPAVFDPTIITPDEKAALRFAWEIPTGAHVALLPGRLTRLKGHPFMIEAMRSLGDRNVVAVFAGAGREAYRQELLELADGLPVRFVGHIDDMPVAYAASDVVVSASDKPEAFGRVMAEAGAMGLPVVATNHGGAREIVVDGQTGWLIPPGDAASLADGIRRSLAASGPAFAARARAHVRRDSCGLRGVAFKIKQVSADRRPEEGRDGDLHGSHDQL